jgi:hypothetical protein
MGEAATVAVLSFDVDAESPILELLRGCADHAMVMTHQAYGQLVGVPRILDVLAQYGLRARLFRPPGSRSTAVPASSSESSAPATRSAIIPTAIAAPSTFPRRRSAQSSSEPGRAGVGRCEAPRGIAQHREASWRRPVLVPGTARRSTRRSLSCRPLGPRRLGAVRAPAAPPRRRDRADEGARPVDRRARRDAALRLPVPGHLPPV